MNHILLSKIQHGIEALFIFLTISWQPLFGIVASIAAVWYYSSMVKLNVVDRNFGGSWRKYLKSYLKKKKKN